MSHSGRLQVLASLLAVGGLAACTSASVEGGAPQQPAESTSPSAASDPSGDTTEPPVLQCQDPGASLLATAKAAIAPHPGPVRAATLVRAVKTGTGTWYVIGIDRAYVRDDGTPTGSASRSVALTNAPAGVNFIPLGEGVTHKPFATSWDRVWWTGSRLAAGERALRRAVGCLDAAADK
jgi:hypothetical protein